MMSGSEFTVAIETDVIILELMSNASNVIM